MPWKLFEESVFKYLRNKEHMKRLFDLRDLSYDKELSMDGNYRKKFKIFINQDDFEGKPGFNRLDEEEKFQKLVKRHSLN